MITAARETGSPFQVTAPSLPLARRGTMAMATTQAMCGSSKDGAAWNQLGNDIDGEVAGDKSGTNSLSNDGTVIAISAFGMTAMATMPAKYASSHGMGPPGFNAAMTSMGKTQLTSADPSLSLKTATRFSLVHLATLTTATMLAISASSIGMALPGSNAATTSMEKPPTTTSDKTSPFQVTATRLLLVQLTTMAMERIQVMPHLPVEWHRLDPTRQ